MNKTHFNKAVKTGNRLMKEKEIQMPDWEWVSIRHKQKMSLRVYKKLWKIQADLFKNLL